MMTRKLISVFLNGLFILMISLFLLDGVTSFEIKDQIIKSFAYFGVLILTPTILIWNLLTFETSKKEIIATTLPTLTLIGILVVGPIKIAFSSSAWKTQTILYQSGHLPFKKVEFQMQDVGAFGYNRRTVEVTYLTSLFMVVEPFEKDNYERVEWVRVNEEVNELGLRFP